MGRGGLTAVQCFCIWRGRVVFIFAPFIFLSWSPIYIYICIDKINHFFHRSSTQLDSTSPLKSNRIESNQNQVDELGPYRMLVEEAHDLISSHSADENVIFTYASGGFRRLLGINPVVRVGARACLRVAKVKGCLCCRSAVFLGDDDQIIGRPGVQTHSRAGNKMRVAPVYVFVGGTGHTCCVCVLCVCVCVTKAGKCRRLTELSSTAKEVAAPVAENDCPADRGDTHTLTACAIEPDIYISTYNTCTAMQHVHGKYTPYDTHSV